MTSPFEAPASYVIDVCATCGVHATYPFTCGHRSSTDRWTAPIVVKPSKATRRAVETAMRISAELGRERSARLDNT